MALVKFSNGYDKQARSPYSELLNSFFQTDPLLNGGVARVPAVNISETEAEFILDFAVPGMNKENFKLNVDDNKLSVNAEVKQEAGEKKFTRKEFSYGSFQRTFNLPDSVNQEGITATYQNGILSVSLAKKEESKPAVREITVK